MSDLREKIVKVVDKEFGAGRSMSLTQLPECGVGEWVSTDSIIINAVISRPGIPVGRLTAIAGKPYAGKSTLALHIIKLTQEAGGLGVVMDTEHRYDPSRAAEIGVRNDEVLFYQDLCLEETFSIIHRIADVNIKNRSRQQITIIVDSHSGTATRAEVDADPDASKGEIASSARVTSLHLRRLCSSGLLERGRIALVFICQIKSAPMAWGAGETYLAKAPIDYHATLILRVRGKQLKKKDGIEMHVRVAKNGVGPPFGECEVDVLEHGIDESRQLLEVAVKHNVVEVSGGGHYSTAAGSFTRREWRKVLQESPGLRRELFCLCTGLLGGRDNGK